ncbi:glycoprotein [Lleida bat lyssavirus]|uniref:Glycoprotein n=1 Tax=Lleida bat lyssavirus TaxID=1213198 RepID=A0A1I9RGZ9_9RHAB|nr:glycoprotein [Lleida bat lyssavirus]AOZ21306.1 glycoprotein [Lleida bat lyssavirus]AZB73865.1 glycoprotein [Lleida bat lyssavirus]
MAYQVTLILNSLSFITGQDIFPLYTIPDSIGPWTPIDLSHLKCPDNAFIVDENCTDHGEINYSELKPSFHSQSKVPGFTCTGIVTQAVTYTNFLGYVSTTFQRSHFVPNPRECRAAQEWKSKGDPRYEDSLQNPYPDSKWLRTVTTTRESLLIIEPAIAEMDIYNKTMFSSVFRGGLCDFSRGNPDYCETSHSYSIWMPYEESRGITCDIFQSSTGRLFKKDDQVCGIQDERGMFKSTRGACKMTICGKSGVRLYDGTWISYNTIDNLKVCPRSAMVNMHTTKLDALEEAVVRDLVKKREECLNAFEEIIITNSISFRKMSLFRKMVPGSGLVYTMINKTLMEAHGHYKSVSNWSEILPTPICLLVKGKCYQDHDGVLFNGIVKDHRGKVLIPEMQSHLLQDHFELLRSNTIPWRHPLVHYPDDTDPSSETAEFIQLHMRDPAKVTSDIDFGLSSWKRYLIFVACLILGLLILWVVIKYSFKVYRVMTKKRSSRRKMQDILPDPVIRSVGGNQLSWESYKNSTNL